MINGNVVRARLREQRKTQRELAEFVGTDPSNIAKYLSNKIDPRGEIIEKIAIFLGVPIDAIWLYTSTPSGGEVVAENRVPYRTQEVKIVMIINSDTAVAQHQQGLGTIRRPIADPDAYGILLNGVSMSPALPPGSRLIISPNAGYREDRLHLVKLKSGEALVRRVVSNEAGYLLIPFNNQFPPRHVDNDQVEQLGLIVAVDLPG